MNTAVTLFEDKGQLPAYLADINEETNIVTRERIDALSFRGKVWRVILDGNETIVQKSDGEPATAVAGVILDYNKNRSRAYFAGAYVEGQTSMPDCWSPDGVKPDPKVKEPQSEACATCPMSMKGSKVVDGKEMTACSQFKRAVFVPITNTKHPPLLLKLPATSIWDKDAEEFAAKGFYAFDQYLDMLKRRGVNHTAAVVTKIKFDPRTSYPKLLFGPLDWVPAAAVADIKEHLANKELIDKILNVDPSGEIEATIPVKTNGEAAPAAPAAAKPAAASKGSSKPAAKPAAPAVDPDDDLPAGFGGTTPQAKPAAKATTKSVKPAAAPAVEVVTGDNGKDNGIGDLLGNWESDD